MDIQVKVDPNDYNIERGVYASWLGNALSDTVAQGLIDDGFAALTTEPVNNNNTGSGNALPTSVTYSTAIPLDNNKYSTQTTISGATAFTLASGAVTGGQYTVRLVADGTNTPTFSSDFEEVTGSSGYDNTANVVNVLSVYYDGVDALYSWTQRIGDDGSVPDTTAPILQSATVENASPTTVTLAFDEDVSQTTTLQAGTFTVSGHTVSAAAFGSATTINLTVDAVTNGETITVSYVQPGLSTNQVQDTSGNLLASFSNQAITNNVQLPSSDDFTNLAHHYSTVPYNGYTGSMIDVRRSSDNAVQTFGVVDGALDTSAILSFVGAGDGFAVTLYDQIGGQNATNATQASQPKIVSSGSLITLGGKPALDFDGDEFSTGTASNALINTEFAVYAVASRRDAFENPIIGGTTKASFQNLILGWIGSTTARLSSWAADTDLTVPAFSTEEATLLACRLDATTRYISKDGGGESTLVDGTKISALSGFRIGSRTNEQYLKGKFAELRIYNNAKAATDANIKNIIKQTYGIA